MTSGWVTPSLVIVALCGLSACLVKADAPHGLHEHHHHQGSSSSTAHARAMAQAKRVLEQRLEQRESHIHQAQRFSAPNSTVSTSVPVSATMNATGNVTVSIENSTKAGVRSAKRKNARLVKEELQHLTKVSQGGKACCSPQGKCVHEDSK